MIRENLNHIHFEIRQAEKKYGRPPGSVRLIAVSKTKPMALIREAYAAGQLDFGENRVQELVDKHPQLPEVRWHMIGHLQRNKVKFIAPFIHLIHSVDSARLLEEIGRQAILHERIIPCLLQINISNEEQKGGFSEAECREVLENMDQYPGVLIRGLMGMAEFTDDEKVIQAQFRRLRLAFDGFQTLNGPAVQMEEISMGMSGDFEIAIAEGSTLVRVGSSIFGDRG
ncbi:MAG: YggS family pyridoxal phosphate-dependent enzyme [Bacteroidia bacterium]|nr:YggS family pyridoxal phosphate-dependent enzyme [Bacteroidia bacterium]